MMAETYKDDHKYVTITLEGDNTVDLFVIFTFHDSRVCSLWLIMPRTV
jgi:hypothetical protein